MTYPSSAKYKCRYCRQTYDCSAGYTSTHLIEHLLRKHAAKAEENRNLYLSDLVKECFEFKGGAHD